MSSVAEPLIDYLRQLEARGQTHVTIDDDVRPILREFFIRAKTGKSSGPLAQRALTATAKTASTTLLQFLPLDQRLCEIHDAARLNELALTVGVDAFLTLEQTYENEGLFDDKLVVAEFDNKVQGFVAYGDAELTWLYVDPNCVRKGVGRALVRHVAADSSPEMEIELLEGNTPALQLYLSEEFKVIERIEGKLEGNEAFAAVGLILRRDAS